MAIWPLLNELIPQAVMQPQNCEEALSVVLLVFRKLADTTVESVDIEGSLLRWGSLLVQHKSREVISAESNISHGTTNKRSGC
jgi:hypothetical protein